MVRSVFRAWGSGGAGKHRRNIKSVCVCVCVCVWGGGMHSFEVVTWSHQHARWQAITPHMASEWGGTECKQAHRPVCEDKSFPTNLSVLLPRPNEMPRKSSLWWAGEKRRRLREETPHLPWPALGLLSLSFPPSFLLDALDRLVLVLPAAITVARSHSLLTSTPSDRLGQVNH